MFKQASQIKLRFKTTKGDLTVEQLWDLPIEELDKLAVSLERMSKSSGAKTFLEVKTKDDEIAKLRFDIALDILNTRQKADKEAQEAQDNKRHNEKILAIMASKQDEKLNSMSIEELQAQLK